MGYLCTQNEAEAGLQGERHAVTALLLMALFQGRLEKLGAQKCLCTPLRAGLTSQGRAHLALSTHTGLLLHPCSVTDGG